LSGLRSGAGRFHSVEGGLMYTRCQNNGLVCIAAFSLVQRSIAWNHAHPTAKGRPEAAFNTLIQLRYSAACLRGGSSAPESWISAIWWSLKPSTWRRISSVCSPSSGERCTSVGLSDSLIGLPTEKYLPRVGWSTSTTVPV